MVEALVGIGKRHGVNYRLSTPVSSVSISEDSREATGVTLKSGEYLAADVVIINADLVYAYNNLLPPSTRAASLSKRASSCSSISFYWAMDRIIPELKVHNIFLADAYRESFDDIFQRQLMPEQPSFYVNVPSRVDPSAAPPGKDAIVVLVPVGHLLDEAEGQGLKVTSAQDWEAMIHKARETVFSTIEERTGARGLRQSVISEDINTPRSWQERFNLDKGAILGISHSFFNVLSFRPRTKHPDIQRCYFVGASTHPGTGVPICLAGSKLTSEQILEAHGMKKPWGTRVEKGTLRGRTGIDRVEPRPLLSRVHAALMLVLLVILASLYQLGCLGFSSAFADKPNKKWQ